LTGIQKRLVDAIKDHSIIRDRVQRLLSIQGIGEITALTGCWRSVNRNGFTPLPRRSAIVVYARPKKNRPASNIVVRYLKKRNKHLQTVLVEAAKLAPRWNPHLAQIHQKELAKGNKNKATLAVARKLVAYMLAVDKNKRVFQSMAKAMVA
jgi:transposase